MTRMPAYEIWGTEPGSMRPMSDRFIEDCVTAGEARSACDQWRAEGRAVHVRDKETGRLVRLG